MTTYVFPQAQAPFTLSYNSSRPNNTTQYTANDVMYVNTASGAADSISDVGLIDGQTIIISGAELTSDNTTRTTGFLQAELWLLNATITVPGDNNAWDLSFANMRDKAVAIINLNETHYSSAGYKLINYNLEKIVTLDAADTALYAVVVVTNAYTPIANENFSVTIKGKR